METPVKGAKGRPFDPLADTYLSSAGIKKTRATEDIPQAIETEVVRGNEDERSESEIFCRNSLLMHSPPGANDGEKRAVSPIGSLPDMGDLKPVVRLERLQEARIRRASTPLGMTRTSEGDESVAIIGDLTITQEDAGQMEYDGASEVSLIVFAPSRTHKRSRNISSESVASASVTDDEDSVAVFEEKHKKKKRGRLRTTNIIDKVMARRAEKEKEQQQERDEWKRKRMEDPNLIVPPATSLPGLSEVTEGLKNQPTPDLTSEVMQVVQTIEKWLPPLET